VTLVPGREPFRALAVALAHLLDREPAALEADLRADPSLAGRLARGRRPADGGLILVVDQLAETVTLAGASARDAFLAVIAGFGALAPGVRVLFTLRSDFLDHFGTIERGPLARSLLRATFMLPPMGADARCLAVVGPARVRGFALETDAMADQLVAEGQIHPGGDALPLLSFLLSELWMGRDPERRLLPAAALARLGGAAALARHGDTVLSTLSAEERRAARGILLALVTSGETRARRTREELTGRVGGHPQAPGGGGQVAERALEALIRGRLVLAGEGYEIAHEALVRAWPRLCAWLDEASDERAAARRLAEAAAEWEPPGGRAKRSGARGSSGSSPRSRGAPSPARPRARSRRRAAGRCGEQRCGGGRCGPARRSRRCSSSRASSARSGGASSGRPARSWRPGSRTPTRRAARSW